MSNRVNRALADAWLVADIAATERSFEQEHAFALEQWDQDLKDAESAMRTHEDERAGWADIGSKVGAAVGTVAGFFIGGPAGAVEGGIKGFNVGDDLAMMGYDLDSYHIDKVDKETSKVKEFDYDFSRESTKYKTTQDKEKLYDVAEEAAVDKAEETIGKFEDAYIKSDWEIAIDTGQGLYEGWQTGESMFETVSTNVNLFGKSDAGEWLGADKLIGKGKDWQTKWEGVDAFGVKMDVAMEGLDQTTEEGMNEYLTWISEYDRLFGES